MPIGVKGFQKGTEWKGNATGRPKKHNIFDYLSNNDITELVNIARKQAKEGKAEMIKFLLEHIFGKAPLNLELGGDIKVFVVPAELIEKNNINADDINQIPKLNSEGQSPISSS